MSIVSDFKSIRSKLERMEQKAEFDVNNPPPPAWYSAPVVWTPEQGYGQAGQPVSDEDRLALYQMYGLGYQGDPEWAPN